LLGHAGLTAELSVLTPDALAWNPRPEEFCLVLLDGEFRQPWETIVCARQLARMSRFVWLLTEITPQAIHAALGAGLHGVLSTSLPLKETCQALVSIWQGECQFRYGNEHAPKMRAGLAGEAGLPVWTKALRNAALTGERTW